MHTPAVQRDGPLTSRKGGEHFGMHVDPCARFPEHVPIPPLNGGRATSTGGHELGVHSASVSTPLLQDVIFLPGVSV